MYRIGNSIDIHPLVKNAPLYIGGVKIESEFGSLSHSDGDALLHSICEAIIGALGKGDLGSNFSEKDPKFEGIRSTYFVEEINKMLKENGYEISNIDCMLVLEKPNLSNYKKSVENSIAKLFNIKENKVNIKAGTNEKIGSIGNSESYLCWTSVLLEERK